MSESEISEISEAISVLQCELSWANQNRYPYVSQKEVKAYRMAINSLKALEREPKTGHWILHKLKGIDIVECSECFGSCLRLSLIQNNYCPDCGCRMIES